MGLSRDLVHGSNDGLSRWQLVVIASTAPGKSPVNHRIQQNHLAGRAGKVQRSQLGRDVARLTEDRCGESRYHW